MKAGEGLHPSARGARILFKNEDRKVVDGPFAETKELIAGFWIWEVKSFQEAIEWARRIPNPTRSEEHTSELQSPCNLVCRLLLEKKKKKQTNVTYRT